MTASDDATRLHHETPAPDRATIAALEQQIVELKQELWASRDATIGATAELGTARAKIRELEALIHQLRIQVQTQDADLRSRLVVLARGASRPARVLRRVLR